jgi:phage terminase small subunit
MVLGFFTEKPPKHNTSDKIGHPKQAAYFVVCKKIQFKMERGDDVMKLTPKQEAFVDAYIEMGNASEAARRAGYSFKIANRIATENLSKPVIQQAIHDRQEEIRSKRTATVTEVMEFLTSVMRGEIMEKVIVTEGKGLGESEARLVEKPPSIADRTKAADHILKRFGRPPKQEAEEQKLRIEKLKVEAEALTTVKNNAEMSVGMLQLVDSLNRAHREREDREDEE